MEVAETVGIRFLPPQVRGHGGGPDGDTRNGRETNPKNDSRKNHRIVGGKDESVRVDVGVFLCCGPCVPFVRDVGLAFFRFLMQPWLK